MEVYLVRCTDDILKNISYLSSQEYYVEWYYVSQKNSSQSTQALSSCIKKLWHHGWLTLMDPTHKTNKYNWCFFTLYIHDEYKCWNVDAHFLLVMNISDHC